MTMEFWGTVFSGLTFVVIAVTAVAAMIQLRHLRAGNQLAALITILEDWQKSDMQQDLQFVRRELPNKLKDPAFLAGIDSTPDRTVHRWLNVCDYFEQLGSYVRYGLMDKESFLSVGCYTYSSSYVLMQPCIERYRIVRDNPGIYENFEYIAVLGKQWILEHPKGDWPRGVPHFSELPEG